MKKTNSDKGGFMIKNSIWERAITRYKSITSEVNPSLKEHIEKTVFPKYARNDDAHGIIHILEVIRRSFVLNSVNKLGLDIDMIFAIAACHDLSKYIDSDKHHMIAAQEFIQDKKMKKFFNDEQRLMIQQAIEDHRSSKEDEPRSEYGKLVSSADRNTSIEMVFIRSFLVAKARMPEENIEDYLDYTFKRLSKRYSVADPENMFFEDQEYREFLKEMRELLSSEKEFKKRCCEVNHILDRGVKVKDCFETEHRV